MYAGKRYSREQRETAAARSFGIYDRGHQQHGTYII